MFADNNLSDVWVLVKCGDSDFAINYKYINSIGEFSQAKCINTTAITGIKRGTYNILGIDILVLDGRKLTGEKSTETIKLEQSAYIDEMKQEILKSVDDLDWAILDSKELNLDYTKYKLYKWLTKDTPDNDINAIKNRMMIPYKEVFVMAEEALHNKDNLSNSLKTSEAIRNNIDKMIIRPLNKVADLYNKNINENCLIIQHNDCTYGLTVDSIIAITEEVQIVSRYSEYKIIAGDCWYKSRKYNIFNTKYLTGIAKKFKLSASK